MGKKLPSRHFARYLLAKLFTCFLKAHYGLGIDLRLTETKFDRWGMYGVFGLELFGLTFSTKIIGHPGQPNFEQEYRYGFMAYPVDL